MKCAAQEGSGNLLRILPEIAVGNHNFMEWERGASRPMTALGLLMRMGEPVPGDVPMIRLRRLALEKLQSLEQLEHLNENQKKFIAARAGLNEVMRTAGSAEIARSLGITGRSVIKKTRRLYQLITASEPGRCDPMVDDSFEAMPAQIEMLGDGPAWAAAPDLSAPDQRWRLGRAVCAEVDDPDIFFPDPDRPDDRLRTELALAVCRVCPLMMRCREDVLRYPDEFAIRGGLTPADREDTGRVTARPIKCG